MNPADKQLPNRRRNFFIDKRLQGMWALLNLGIAGLIVLIVSLEILRSIYIRLGWPMGGRAFSVPDILFIVKLILITIVGGAFFWILSAFSAHRFAGPIWRLNQSLKEVTKGNYKLRIKFRKKDFFQEVANTFNVMNESIEKTIQEKDQEIAELKKKLNLT